MLDKKVIITATAIKDGKQIARTFKYELDSSVESVIPFGALLEREKRPFVALRVMSPTSDAHKKGAPKPVLEHLQLALEVMGKAMQV